MSHLDEQVAFGLVSGLPLVALAAWVALLRPRRHENLAFALFAGAFGLRASVSRMRELAAGPLETAFGAAETALLLLSAFALVRLAFVLPRPPAGLVRRAFLASASVALALALALGALHVVRAPATGEPAWSIGVGVGFAAMLPALLVPLGTLPARMQAAETPAERSQVVWLAVALTIYPGAVAAAGAHRFVTVAGDPALVHPWTIPAVALAFSLPLVAAQWLAASARPHLARAGRNLALFTLAVPLATVVALAVAPEFSVTSLARVATVLVLAVAILRGQLLGVDVKVRFAISKSTVAAAFIAVFFVASEGAQLVFGAENAVVGLLAAGALVFAIAPLQRAADRLAERAVPVAASSVTHATGNEAAYRNAVRLALRDRRLTHEEEIQLFHVAQALGVPAGRAMEIRHEVEREAGPATRT